MCAYSGTKTNNNSAARRAYELLHHEIIECRLAPGEHLTEASMARRLGLGKTPVREALRQLVFQGLVLVASRHGYYVARITIRDVDELFEMRRILESAAARLAVKNQHHAGLARLEKLSATTWRVSERDSLKRFLRANTAFHLEIAGLAGNRRLVENIRQLLSESDRLINFGMTQRQRQAEQTVAQHPKLAQAIRAGNAELASRIAEEHIEDTRRMIIQALLSDARFREMPIG
jgi:DNA-binding GntR family transcriptional regulator